MIDYVRASRDASPDVDRPAGFTSYGGTTPVTVAVISGGTLHERDVSLRSGSRLAHALRLAGAQVRQIDMSPDLITRLRRCTPDVVWPMIHGVEGEDGSLQDLLELCGWGYVGTEPAGCRIATAKPVAKAVVAKNGLATPNAVALPQSVFKRLGAATILEQVEESMGFPVIVKPANGGSALGLSLARDAESLRMAMVDAFAYGEQVVIERFVEGREIAVSIVEDEDGPRALPPVEIRTDEGTYDYDARYDTGRTEFFAPAPLSAEQHTAVTELALSCHRVLELRDYSRIDVILDADDNAWFIDANVTPGMTDTSLFPLAAEADSSFTTLVAGLVQRALARTQDAGGHS
ncbi:D-alanine--D-alanine ligase [Nanchangia anserum]|uniref:D-alanine--D-alanine ligase n=2 Tax=Nanchangia anserum TaxID=2692125 RepID=A0A8I0G9H4_9ACTO|nr:D-alanine--D-alanine ligase [Nanchangia anserum]QOX82667.1 D-alanine--D-alanine ligase [Nanchangia anserum]